MAPHKKKILIVEDEKPLSYALELKLQAAGFETVTARNGEEALTALGAGGFDLVLTDLMMPKKDGFSVLEELKKQKSAVPVFVMSNLGQEEDMKRATALGAREYIAKSTTPLKEIAAKVISFLNHE